MQMPAPQASSPRPRIGVDFHTFDGIFQGSRSHLLGLYEQAVVMAPHWDFFLMLAEPERLLQAHPVFKRGNVHLVRMPPRNGLWRLGWQLPRLAAQLRLDVLHVQYRLPWWGRAALACTIHDVLFETHPQFFSRSFAFAARWTSRDAVKRSAALLTVSEYSRAQMARSYGVDPERVAVTFNGVDTSRFHPDVDAQALVRHGLSPGAYVCCLGRLEPRKNHLTLVRAFARLPDTGVPLVVVGQRDFAYQAVFDEVQRLGLTGRVRFLEDVTDHELPSVLRHARLFVYPSWAEGFGMPVLEAMACGVPVVTSDSTALREVAQDVAWLVPPDDVHALGEVMRQAFDETTTQRQRRIDSGLARAEAFNWRASAAVLLAAFERVLAERVAAP